MIFLELDLAIYKRLTGFPLDSNGRPQLGTDGHPINREVIGPPDLNPLEKVWDEANQQFIPVYPTLPSYGIRLPMPKNSQDAKRPLSSHSPPTSPTAYGRFEPNSFRQVPVFDQNLEGRKHTDIYPAVTFRWIDLEPDPDVFIYHDPFCNQDQGSTPVELRNAQGDVIQTGYSQNIVRPAPDGWKPVYMIVAWAKTLWEVALMSAQIAALFPQKGAITLINQDGRPDTCDMLLERNVTIDPDNLPLAQAEEENRLFGRGFVYSIDVHLDNTTNEYGIQGSPIAARKTPAIIERLLELDLLMQGVAITQQRELDLNALELKPITE